MIELVLTCGCAGSGTAAVLAAESLGIDTGGDSAIGCKKDSWIDANVSRSDCVIWIGGRQMSWHAATVERASRRSRPVIHLDDYPDGRAGHAEIAAIMANFKCVYITGEFNINTHVVVRRLRSILLIQRRLSSASVVKVSEDSLSGSEA